MTQLEFDFGEDETTIIKWKTEDYSKFYWNTTNSNLAIANIKPDYNMCFTRDGKQIGKLDFNGPELVFSGSISTSARVFLDYLATCFRTRLEQEYNNGLKDGQTKDCV